MRGLRFTPEDIFIRRIQNALLQECISTWRRRGKKLLDINCGDGRILRKLWHNGFDVTATEADAAKRAHAATHMGHRAEIYAALDTHLPFEDGQFDWAVLHLYHSSPETLKAVLAEAIRVAAHGLTVLFWNTSAPIFCSYCQQSCRQIALQGAPWFQVWRALHEVGEGSITTRSTLLFAFSFLRRRCPRLFYSSFSTRLPLGAWTILRLDMSPQSAVTPLVLPTRVRKMPPLEPVLEQ